MLNLSDEMILTIRDVLRSYCKGRGLQVPCRHGNPLDETETDCHMALDLFETEAIERLNVSRGGVVR